MAFLWKNQHHQLEGIDNQSIQLIKFKAISKEMKHGNSIFAVCLQAAREDMPQSTQPDIQQLLQEFEDIYQEPKQLPPQREIAYHINLKEGTKPTDVRPYRYAYFQKAEMEKQVHDMLKLGLIRSTTSPFSYPVLLVKKKKMEVGVSVPTIKPLMLSPSRIDFLFLPWMICLMNYMGHLSLLNLI